MSRTRRPQPEGLARSQRERRQAELDRQAQASAMPDWLDPTDPPASDEPPPPDVGERIAAALERIATQLENHTRIVTLHCPSASRVPT